MASTEALKVAVQEAIDRRGQELIEVATTILQHPEPGFREQKTSQLVARKFREFGIPFRTALPSRASRVCSRPAMPDPPWR